MKVKMVLCSTAILALLCAPAMAQAVVVVDVDSATMYIEPLEDLPDSGNPTGWTARVYDLSQDDGKGDAGNGSAKDASPREHTSSLARLRLIRLQRISFCLIYSL